MERHASVMSMTNAKYFKGGIGLVIAGLICQFVVQGIGGEFGDVTSSTIL